MSNFDPVRGLFAPVRVEKAVFVIFRKCFGVIKKMLSLCFGLKEPILGVFSAQNVDKWAAKNYEKQPVNMGGEGSFLLKLEGGVRSSIDLQIKI